MTRVSVKQGKSLGLRWSNKLMRFRVMAQMSALVMFGIAVALAKLSG